MIIRRPTINNVNYHKDLNFSGSKYCILAKFIIIIIDTKGTACYRNKVKVAPLSFQVSRYTYLIFWL